MGLGTSLLGLPDNVTARALDGDVEGTGGLDHGNGGGESGDEKEKDLVKDIVEVYWRGMMTTFKTGSVSKL